jgi:hypothetical protein
MSQRPRPITILCVILAVFAVISALGGIYAVAQVPDLGRFWSLISTTLFLVSLVLLWKMSRWGPIIFGALTLVNLTVVFSEFLSDVPVGARSLGAFVVPLIYVAVVVPYWSRLKPLRPGIEM